jgi:hypothetical protein
MASLANNVFLRLHKWAARQNENFLTESLAVVLRSLLDLAPAEGIRMVSRITGGFVDPTETEAGAIELRAQVSTDSGRPDLEIRSPNRLVTVEVKAESKLHSRQLDRYRHHLRQSGAESTRLVLLTLYPEDIPAEGARPDIEIRWFELANWLEDEVVRIRQTSEVAGFLTLQFIAFLKARRMALSQVEKALPDGLCALPNLLMMLSHAATACNVSLKRSANWEYIGANLEGGRYWIGIVYAKPEELRFSAWHPIDLDAARRLDVGVPFESRHIPGGFGWRNTVELGSESVHFFSRSKVGQMEWLEHFLRDCLTKARSIEQPDQGPSQADEQETGPDTDE